MAQRRILIAEDEPPVALDEEQLVRDLGHDVVGPVAHLDDALRAVAAAGIDGAVLDIQLAGNSTFLAVAAELDHRGIPFVFVTGSAASGVTARFPSVTVLGKPFDRQALGTAIGDMIARR